MKQLSGIAALIFLVGCASSDDSGADHTAHSEEMEMEAVSASHDMSLYQLTSTWTTQTGEILDLSSLAGKTRVTAMAYTSCEVACPRIVAALKSIQKKTNSDDVGFVLISIDPERDTAEALEAYARKMNLDSSNWTLLTGRPDDVLEIAALLGVRYRKMADGEFAHSNMITVLDDHGVIAHQQNGLGADLTAETAEFVSSF